MPPKKTPNAVADVPAEDVAIGSDVAPAGEDNGVRPPPYDAVWINVAAASKRAGVTTQTVRNAYREHAAFTPDVDGSPRPAWFLTKMVDAFGNVTDYDVIYLDKAAVDAWVVARAEKAASGGGIGGRHTGAKRRIIRITDEQFDAQPKMTVDGVEVAAITLADGTMVAMETPTGNVSRKKNADAGNADGSAGNGVEVTTADADNAADAGADLFDVELAES